MLQGHIYIIKSYSHPECEYVGSTFKTLESRWGLHKSKYLRWLEGKNELISIFPFFNKWGISDFHIILVKSYMVCDRQHLSSYEQLWKNRINL